MEKIKTYLILLLTILVISCGTTKPYYFDREWGFEHDYPPREKAASVASAKISEKEMISQGYIKIGKVEFNNNIKKCQHYNDKCETAADYDPNIDPVAMLQKRAAQVGGDKIIVTTLKEEKTKEGGAGCVSGYASGPCISYGANTYTVYFETSRAEVWRYQPDLAMKQQQQNTQVEESSAFAKPFVQGDISSVRKILSKYDEKMLKTDDRIHAAFNRALSNRQFAIARLMLEKGIPASGLPDAAKQQNIDYAAWYTPLQILIQQYIWHPWEGEKSIFGPDAELVATVALLLKKGADPNARSYEGDRKAFNYPIIEAAYKNDANLVRLLLDAGADPTVKDSKKWSAVGRNDVEISTSNSLLAEYSTQIDPDRKKYYELQVRNADEIKRMFSERIKRIK